MFVHAYGGYERWCMGKGELKPLTKGCMFLFQILFLKTPFFCVLSSDCVCSKVQAIIGCLQIWGLLSLTVWVCEKELEMSYFVSLMVDSLDTMLIMGLDDMYSRGKRYLQKYLDWNKVLQL
jgi:hypothetical protein